MASVSNNNKQKENLKKWVRHIENIRLPIFFHVQKYIHFHGAIIELGAGTCWLSANLSRIPTVSQIIAIERDSERINLAQSYFLQIFHASMDKITILESDFHKLDFPDNSIDFIVADAALHHADNLLLLLQESYRVLKNKGLIVAIREPILPSFLPLLIWRKYTFGWREQIKGATENIYSREQWQKFFKSTGFFLEFRPIFTSRTLKEKLVGSPILRWGNGFLFSRYFFIASKSKSDMKQIPKFSNERI